MSEIDNIKEGVSLIESDIANRREERAQSEGAIKTYMKRLKDGYGISSEKELVESIKDGKAELEEIGLTIKGLYKEILDEYERATS